MNTKTLRRLGIGGALVGAVLWYLIAPGPAAMRGAQIALIATIALLLVAELGMMVVPQVLRSSEAELNRRFVRRSTSPNASGRAAAYRGPGSGSVRPVVGFLGLLAAWLLFGGAMAAAQLIGGGGPGSGIPAVIVVVLTGIVSGLGATFLHFIPNHSRALKYNLAMAFMATSWMAYVAMNEGRGMRATLEVLIGTVVGKGWWVLLGQPLFVVGVSVLLYVLLKPNQPVGHGTAESVRVRQVHRFVLSAVPYILVSAVVLIGLPQIQIGRLIVAPTSNVFAVLVAYLIVRYYVIHRLAHSPVLYLRSFGYADAPRVFSKVVAPAVSSEAVVTGLVHSRQLASDLMEGTHPGRHARLHVVRDEDWQDWVRERLQTCVGAIIDDSVGTSSVQWEVSQALEALSPDRVLTIRQVGRRSDDSPPPSNTVEYDLGSPATLQRARDEVREWVQAVVA